MGMTLSARPNREARHFNRFDFMSTTLARHVRSAQPGCFARASLIIRLWRRVDIFDGGDHLLALIANAQTASAGIWQKNAPSRTNPNFHAVRLQR